MKIYQGKFGKDTQMSNSLVYNLLKYPNISQQIIKQYPQYSLSYFMESLGRMAKEVTIGSNDIKWFIQGRLNQPSTVTGVYSGTGVGNSTFSVETEENYINPNDVIRFKDKTMAVAIGTPTETANGFTYNFRLVTNLSTATFDGATNCVAGLTVGKVTTAFPEKSKQGFGETKYPDQFVNYLGISRKSKSVSGDALTDVTWLENNGHRVWFYKDHQDCQDEFMYELEKDRWYGESTVDANGNCLVFDEDGKPIFKGDGYLAQVDSSNIDTYSGSLSERRIVDFVGQLRNESGIKDATYLVHTGLAGIKTFAQAMKDYYISNPVLHFDATSGTSISLGNDYMGYHALGTKFTLVHNPIMDDRNIHQDLGPDGFPKESSNFYFMNVGMLDGGTSNVELFVKGAEGVSRGFIMKYIPGMVNPFDQNSVLAATADDSFTAEYLAHHGVVVRNPKACGNLLLA